MGVFETWELECCHAYSSHQSALHYQYQNQLRTAPVDQLTIMAIMPQTLSLLTLQLSTCASVP